MDNLSIYNVVKKVPLEAQKPIKGGRLVGMTDINPMWRIKTLTEQFGPCGIGWKYTLDKQWIEQGSNDEIAAFVNISLYYKLNNEWSEGVPGTGGSSFVAKERSGLYVSDECFKMALTDALSVACKCLGIGADVYFEKDRTKYTSSPEAEFDLIKVTKQLYGVAMKRMTADEYKNFKQALHEAKEISSYDDRKWSETDCKKIQEELLKLKQKS